MSHAQTFLLTDDVGSHTIGCQKERMYTANAATIASSEAAQRFVGMAHCGIKAMRRQKGTLSL